MAQESIPALGHSKKAVVLTKATTQANGKKSTICETCDENFGETRIYRIQTITLAKEKYTCDGKAKTPAVTVIDYNKDQLIKDRDYTVTYENETGTIAATSTAQASVTNEKKTTVETGILLDSAPYVLMFAVAAAGLSMNAGRKRRKA